MYVMHSAALRAVRAFPLQNEIASILPVRKWRQDMCKVTVVEHDDATGRSQQRLYRCFSARAF